MDSADAAIARLERMVLDKTPDKEFEEGDTAKSAARKAVEALQRRVQHDAASMMLLQ